MHIKPKTFFFSFLPYNIIILLRCIGWAETLPPTEFLMDHAFTFSPSRRAVLYRYFLIISNFIVYVKTNKYYNNNSI